MAVHETYVCDRCGSVIKELQDLYKFRTPGKNINFIAPDSKEFCKTCSDKIIKFMENK